ncbi:MAG: amino acid permease [Burkholderiaceae bacterium]|nr:amino acid permease [Burkholderiaceae bacterium]
MNAMTDSHLDADTAQLKALGYSSDFERSMSLSENFSLGFTYLSPVVGVYSVFAVALAAGGPAMFWTYLLVGLGQLMVCLVFGEVVAQFPISGGLYPWARRLVGTRWAWMAGWIYLWALWTSIAAVAVGGAPFVAQLLNIELGNGAIAGIAVVAICCTTVLNLSGTRLLARVAMFGFICELLGAIAVGAYLLFFARRQDLSVLFNTYHFGRGVDYLPALLAASVGATFCYYGFEACGDVAEETPNPGQTIPRAMRMTVYVGGAAAMLVCLALLLAVPDMQAAISGQDADPVTTVLKTALGDTGYRIVIGIVLVSFFSCLLSLQAAASRLLFSYARDDMIVGSAALKQLSGNNVPSRALVLAGLIPMGIAVMGYFMENAIKTIIMFGSMGIYVGFQMIVLGALYARWKGWKPSGKFTLGAWAWPVNTFALVFGIGAIVNLAWPRSPNDPWFLNFGMALTLSIVLALGLTYMLVAKPHGRGNAPSGDAIPR